MKKTTINITHSNIEQIKKLQNEYKEITNNHIPLSKIINVAIKNFFQPLKPVDKTTTQEKIILLKLYGGV